MSGGKFHVHGPHDHALEGHADHGDDAHKTDSGFVQVVAIFTAILATVGAIVSYQGGHAQNEALYFKNEAVLKKADASNQWAFYQAKSTKQNLAELAEAISTDAERKAKYATDVKRYGTEKEELMKKARALDALSDKADERSRKELYPHERLAQSMTFIQIAISLAAICVLTRRRWMLGLAGIGAVGGLVYWGWAFVPPVVPGVTN